MELAMAGAGQSEPGRRPTGYVDSAFARGYLGIGSKRLQRECKAGRLEHRRTAGGRGGRGEFRFKVAWLDAWLDRKDRADG